MIETQTGALGRCLQRMDAARARLDGLGDTKASGVARELVEAMLDLHGLALARTMTIVQASLDSDSLTRRLAEDDYVAAIMLLHGLHPEEPETRLRKTIAAERAHWGVRGFHVDLLDVKAAVAHVRVHWGEECRKSERTAILVEIEDALTEAAPDLDQILLHENEPRPERAPADMLQA